MAKGFSLQDPELKRNLKELMMRSTWASLRAYSADWALIIGAATFSWKTFALEGVSAFSFGIYCFACLIIASRQKGFENLTHEASHYNLSANRTLNDTMCYGLGAMWPHPSLSLHGQRRSHIKGHHAYFWDPVHDSE